MTPDTPPAREPRLSPEWASDVFVIGDRIRADGFFALARDLVGLDEGAITRALFAAYNHGVTEEQARWLRRPS